jgi:hypothetical protein
MEIASPSIPHGQFGVEFVVSAIPEEELREQLSNSKMSCLCPGKTDAKQPKTAITSQFFIILQS